MMTTYEDYDLDELEADVRIPRIKNLHIKRKKKVKLNKRRPLYLTRQKMEQIETYHDQQADDKARFKFTYQAARHESGWLLDSLGSFYDQHWSTEKGWISDVNRVLKGGKEASVYLCTAAETAPVEFIAAKVYRPRQHRALKKDHVYREGRERLDEDGRIIDSRKLRAMRQGTRRGLRFMQTSWIEHELSALKKLHAAGADVPQTFASASNAILMTYIGDEFTAAPTLNTVKLKQPEAARLFECVIHNVRLMLANNMIHGDLSAYNILYWDGEITIIDFPQVINPYFNRSAGEFFRRDIHRVSEYFSRQGVKINVDQLTTELWFTRYQFSPTDMHYVEPVDDVEVGL